MSHAHLSGKAGGDRKSDAAKSFFSEVGGNSETRFFNEEALRFIHRPHMLFDVVGVDAPGTRAPAIQVFVDVGYAVFPDLFLPIRSRQLVLQDALVAIKRCRLASLLFQSHLRQEIFDASIDWR